MRRVAKGFSTIEILVLVGLLGIILFTVLKSYRSYLVELERNFTTIDFDDTVDLIEREFLLIKGLLNVESGELASTSLKLDTASEWLDLVNSKIDLRTENILITSLDGSIEGNDLVIGVGIRASDEIEKKNQLVCWESSSHECMAN